MISYIIRRLLISIFVIIGVSVLTFLLTRVVPSAPARVWLGPKATDEQIARIRIRLGLDKPIYIQYYRYMNDVLHGNWGISIKTHQPILKSIANYLPASLELVTFGMFIAFVVGVSSGIISAARSGMIVDHVCRLFSIGGIALPAFWVGMMLQIVFFKELGLFPLQGRIDLAMSLTHPVKHLTGLYLFDSLVTGNITAFWSALWHIVLPGITITIYSIGLFSRMTRAIMLEILGEDYIRTAKAYGVSEMKILTIYALRNAAGPVITVTVMSFGYALVETFLVESIFNWPGVGLFAARAFMAMDFPVIMSITLLLAFFYIVLNLSGDVCLALLNPRIRLK